MSLPRLKLFNLTQNHLSLILEQLKETYSTQMTKMIRIYRILNQIFYLFKFGSLILSEFDKQVHVRSAVFKGGGKIAEILTSA